MSTDHSTPKNRLKLVPAASPASDTELVSRIDINLCEAHAILDLIHTMTSVRSCADEHVESLGRETLNGAVYSAMARIREAQEASGKLASTRPAEQS